MSLDEISSQMPYYATLKPEEKTRMYPCWKVTCVMISGDSPPPLQSSLPSTGYDLPDEVRHGKIIPAAMVVTEVIPATNGEANVTSDENIEESITATMKTLPILEQHSKIESNGFDHTDSGKLVNDIDDDSCLVQCVYFTQQCCECTIL